MGGGHGFWLLRPATALDTRCVAACARHRPSRKSTSARQYTGKRDGGIMHTRRYTLFAVALVGLACLLLAAASSRQARPTKATAKSVYLRVCMMPSHHVFLCTDVRTSTPGLDCDGHMPLC